MIHSAHRLPPSPSRSTSLSTSPFALSPSNGDGLPVSGTRIYPGRMTHAPTALDIAAQAGIDLGLIKDNLRLSYEERVLKHQHALDLVLAIEQARRERRQRRK